MEKSQETVLPSPSRTKAEELHPTASPSQLNCSQRTTAAPCPSREQLGNSAGSGMQGHALSPTQVQNDGFFSHFNVTENT